MTTPRHRSKFPVPVRDTWNELPLGFKEDGKVAILDVAQQSRTLIFGPLEMARLVLQRAALSALECGHDVVVVDAEGGGAEYTVLANRATVPTNLDNAWAVLAETLETAQRRQTRIRKSKVREWSDTAGARPVTVIIDGLDQLLSLEGKSLDSSWARVRVAALLNMLASIGSSSGVYLVASTCSLNAVVFERMLHLSGTARIQLLVGGLFPRGYAAISSSMRSEPSIFRIDLAPSYDIGAVDWETD